MNSSTSVGYGRCVDAGSGRPRCSCECRPSPPMELRCSTATGRPGHAIFITLFTDKALVRVDTTAQITDRWELPGALGPVQTTTINGDVWVADPTIDTVYRIRP